MNIEPGRVYRYAKGPAALLSVALVMPERGEVFGQQCCGTPIYWPTSKLQPVTKADLATWHDHLPFRRPYAPYYLQLSMEGNDMDDISIDLETLSTLPNAAILSIGAVQFNRDTGKIGKKFSTTVNIDDAIKHGHVSGDTLSWWVMGGAAGVTSDDNAAVLECFDDAAVDMGGNDKPNLHAALCRLVTFVKDCSPNPRVWGNGATADITWLESAFASAGGGMKVPWHFKGIRDMRTLVEAAQLDVDTVKKVDGPKHTAIVDAEWQAHAIAAATMKINVALAGKKVPQPVVEDDDEL